MIFSSKAPSFGAIPDFADRHIGVSTADIDRMLKVVKATDLHHVIASAIPESVRSYQGAFEGFPRSLTITQLHQYLRNIAQQNKPGRSLIGRGFSPSQTPPPLRRLVLENPSWYTSYTPYQAEISQGRLEALLIFQTMISQLTGLPVANASLLDEATAIVEAVHLAHRAIRTDKRMTVLLDRQLLPNVTHLTRARAEITGWTIIEFDNKTDPKAIDWSEVFALVVAQVGENGSIQWPDALVEQARAHDVLVIARSDPLALMLLPAPGDLGADVAVGSTQRFGLPMFFGGPHAAFFATRTQWQRLTPGRIVGVAADKEGQTALRLSLQTREQHIRRAKATSNICTAQALPAIMAGLFAVHHGQQGLLDIAEHVLACTCRLAHVLADNGLTILNRTWFDTLTIAMSPEQQDLTRHRAQREQLHFWYPSEGVSVALDECVDEALLRRIAAVLTGQSGIMVPLLRDLTTHHEHAPRIADALAGIERRTPPLQHAYFHHYRCETTLMRLLRRLANKDIALDRGMIPLGSCTMKLNAAAELEPISWPDLVDIHPLAPPESSAGLRAIFKELETDLCRISGMTAASLQPNSGAQGELAGLSAIRRYHLSRQEPERTICLIPSSAHGTNPASAVMIGFTVQIVRCNQQGEIDVNDLRIQAQKAGNKLAAAMITYPSTHGVFEETIHDITRIVHAHGGQLYMDGANYNALVGFSRPHDYGVDVCHFNLHKTFCVPHGGGGPGVGPIAVAKQLEAFLPGNPESSDILSSPAVSGTLYGNASVSVISYAYIRLMGLGGLRKATACAILSANYIAKRLGEYYKVLYSSPNGWVAHECILDTRPFKRSAGVDVEDIAKRLMDYGFHAPTVSWPVNGTLMIEPTESEPLYELDRFIEAMIAIRHEITLIENGTWPRENNPLINAPHTLATVMSENWDRPYTRSVAAVLGNRPTDQKYWPPISRINSVEGDRNLVCSCPPISSYEALP